MSKIAISKNWFDFINEEKYQQTGEALLYRNPLKKTNPKLKVNGSIPTYDFSTSPGDNYIFDQKPFASGFTAYIGHDEVKPGQNSLKSNIVLKRDFESEEYYRLYTEIIFKLDLIKNKMLPSPLSNQDFELSFYPEQLSKEEDYLISSERFFTDCLNEDDILLKGNLRLYTDGYLKWLQDKIDDLNPHVNQILGVGGLSISEATYVYTRFKGKYIHSKTKEKYFVSIFQNEMLPNGWHRVEWIEDKAALFSFMMQTVHESIQAKEIKKYFSTPGKEIRSNNRPSTVNLSIKRILNEAKIRSKQQ